MRPFYFKYFLSSLILSSLFSLPLLQTAHGYEKLDDSSSSDSEKGDFKGSPLVSLEDTDLGGEASSSALPYNVNNLAPSIPHCEPLQVIKIKLKTGKTLYSLALTDSHIGTLVFDDGRWIKANFYEITPSKDDSGYGQDKVKRLYSSTYLSYIDEFVASGTFWAVERKTGSFKDDLILYTKNEKVTWRADSKGVLTNLPQGETPYNDNFNQKTLSLTRLPSGTNSFTFAGDRILAYNKKSDELRTYNQGKPEKIISNFKADHPIHYVEIGEGEKATPYYITVNSSHKIKSFGEKINPSSGYLEADTKGEYNLDAPCSSLAVMGKYAYMCLPKIKSLLILKINEDGTFSKAAEQTFKRTPLHVAVNTSNLMAVGFKKKIKGYLISDFVKE